MNQRLIPTLKRVLIVEDDKFLADLLAQRFSKEKELVADIVPDGESGLDHASLKLSFEIAENGKDGLDKARAQLPELILLDLVLPGIDGYEVLARLKKDPATAAIPVVILSNLGRKEEIDKGLQMGAESYLVKASTDLDEIVAKAKEVLKKHEEKS